MTQQGHTKMGIRTVDTDVLVLAVSVYEQLQEEMEELWVDYCGLTSVLGRIGNYFQSTKHWSTLENVKFVVFPFFTPSLDVIKFRFCDMSPKLQLGKSGICSMM